MGSAKLVSSILTREAVLAMSQKQRCQVVTRPEADRLGFVFIDGVGGPAQFIGTQEEHSERAMSLRGIEPFRNGRSAGRAW